jgi:hypothetical protein
MIFLHLEKTGGTSVRSVVRDVFGPEKVYENIVCRSDGLWRPLEPHGLEASAWQAHMPFGLHAHLPEPSKYFTVVRDPVAREVSRFRSQPQLRKKRRTTPAASVEKSWGMVWKLSGIPLDRVGGLGEEHVKLALRNLRKHFKFVGDTSRMDLLLEWMRNDGWPVDSIPHENCSDRHGIKVRPEEIYELERHPQVMLDQVLYRRICDLGPYPGDW